MTNGEPIDYSSALRRIGSDESFLKELLDLYVATFESKREGLINALTKQNFEEIKAIGHTLKGSSANLSLLPLQEASLELETAGKEANIAKAWEAVTRLEAEFLRLKDFIAARPEA